MWKPYVTKFINIMLCMVFILACTLSSPTQFPRDTSIDANSVTPDFVSILGDDWYADDAIVATVGDDFKSRPASLLYRADVYIYGRENNVWNSWHSVRYTILIYDNYGSALEHYRIQKEVLFYNDPRDSTAWNVLSIDMPHPDEFHVACRELDTVNSERWPKRCKAMFLYDRNIIVLSLGLISEDREIITHQEMFAMFESIDSMFASDDT